MDSRAFWLRLKTHGWAYSFSIAATLALGILIGTVVSYGVKGKEGQKSSDATPLTVPSPKQLSGTFSQIAKQLGPSVVNINTESTIRIRIGVEAGRTPMMTTAAAAMVEWMTSSTASSAGKAAQTVTPQFASVRSVRE